MNLFNLVMASLALVIGYANDLLFLRVIGYIVLVVALLTLITNLILLVHTKPSGKQLSHHS
jgi:hypothetical protein